jgi:hypothetical protein
MEDVIVWVAQYRVTTVSRQAGSACGGPDLVSEPGGLEATEPCHPASPRDRDDLGDEPGLDVDLPDGGERDRN